MTAVAGAVAAIIAVVPHDRAPAVSSTIQNVVSVASSGSTARKEPATAPAPRRTTAAQPPTPAPVPSTGDKWTAGSAYTAILASVSTQAQARTIQRAASARGLDAGVLLSSRFRSLRPGYWVVFSGVFATANEAATHARRARASGFADAYPRYVSP